MPFKIYPTNFILLVLVLLPNLLFIVFPPANIPQESPRPKWWSLILGLEWVGRLMVFILLMFWELKVEGRGQGIIFAIMILCILVYYTGWIRYMIGGREFKLLFEPLFFIPVPMAVFPALYLVLAGVLLNSHPVVLSAVIFTLGHIPESLRNYRL